MKNIKSTLLILVLVIVGIGSFFIYNQQQENRFLEFEGYEVSVIDKRLNELYNDEKDDFAQNVTSDKFAEINQLILEVDDKGYSEKNKSRFEKIKNEFKSAEATYNVELSINDIFEEDSENVKPNTKKDKLTELENNLESYKKMAGFYKRNLTRLEVAIEQLNDIEVAQESVDELFDGEDLHEDVTLEDLEETKQLINKIKNQEFKNSLLAKIVGVEVASSEEEEPEADEDEDGEEDEQEEEVEVVREPELEQEPERTPERQPEPTRRSRPTNPAPPVQEEREPEPEPTPEPRIEYTTERVSINFQKIVVSFSEQLPAGEQEVVTPGQLGEKEITTEWLVYPDSREKKNVSEKVVKQPVPARVREGIMTTNDEEE